MAPSMAFKEYHQQGIVPYKTSASSKEMAFLYS
jgi:hypothetical protein